MSDVYAVRCNFSRPDLEEKWHAWYGGPKLAEMMTRITWLAVWVVESPEAFETPEYKASWGFVDWAPYITDWSRNLFRGPAHDVSDVLDVPPDGSLYLAAFEGVTADDADQRLARLRSERPDVLWMPVIGLDRSWPALGLRRFAPGESAAPLAPALAAGIRETVYRPITSRRRSTRARPRTESAYP